VDSHGISLACREKNVLEALQENRFRRPVGAKGFEFVLRPEVDP
jgi:hypothetical protein